MCPRRLRESTRYRACVVPSFAYSTVAKSYSPAWQIGQGQVNLPVYYSWEFGTGEEGDFESLVRRLGPAPQTATKNLGTVIVDVNKPWDGNTPLSGAPQPAPFPVPGALAQLDLDGPQGAELPVTVMEDFVKRITAQCNAAAALDKNADDDPVAVAPPIYGGRHVVVDTIDPNGGQPPWLHDLSVGVATRVAAGLGAEYIRVNQESLMAHAWEQVGAIREANRRRALGQVAAGVADALHVKHIANLLLGEAVSLAAPAASRVRPWGSAGPPLATTIKVSVMPTAAASTAFARLARPDGPLARAASTRANAVITQAISGSLPVPAARFALVAPDAQVAPAVAVADAATHAVTAQRSITAAGDLLRLQAMSDVARVNGLADVAQRISAPLSGMGVNAVALRTGDVTLLRAAVIPQLNAVTAGVANAKRCWHRP